MRGKAYQKTVWGYQERPVASNKLNLWDDRIEAALELVHHLVSLAWGGGDGVIRGATSQDLRVAATAPASLSVTVAAGYAFLGHCPYRLAQEVETAPVVPPALWPRIDLVQARLATWDVTVKAGTESAQPQAPAPDADSLALARLYLRPGMASIQDTDDGANGYIKDVRVFL